MERTPSLNGLNYYWLKITPTADPQIVAVVNGGDRGHQILFVDSEAMSAGWFEKRYPEARWSGRIPAWPFS